MRISEVWPRGVPRVGQTASRSRTVAILNAVVAEDLPGPGTVFLQVNWSFKAPVRPGDVITGSVEIMEVREDKPISKLKTAVTRQDGIVALEGDAVCYTMALKSQGPIS